MLQLSSDLSVREALSGISGSISLASWILLLVPQLIENVRNKNAEGISTAFLLTWLAGDISNLFGALWADLLPTVVALAFYYCFADFVLLSQVLYYNRFSMGRSFIAAERRHSHRQPHHADAAVSDDPAQPLLTRRESASTQSFTRRRSQCRDSLSALMEKTPSTRTVVTRNALAILGTCLVGTLGWFVAWEAGAWKVRDETPGRVPQEMGAAVLGYISAVLYLGARIPQIVQNYRKESTDGLSMLFFMLSLLGNLSYGAGILFHSTEREYVMHNLPWLIGSLGTMAEDAIIFCQFRIYRTEEQDSAIA